MGTYQQSTGVSIQSAFEKFHADNPLVYTHFKRLAFKAINAGKKKISSKMICNVIRWEVYLETVELNLWEDKSGTIHKFKINDAYTAYYSRLFVNEYPVYLDMFNFRERRS